MPDTEEACNMYSLYQFSCLPNRENPVIFRKYKTNVTD